MGAPSRAGAGRLTIAGIAIDTPSLPAHVLILALHAAQHGAKEPQPLEDLSRADSHAWILGPGARRPRSRQSSRRPEQ